MVTEFANAMGLGHMDQDTFLAAVRCSAIRKELVADYAGKRFVPAGTVDYDVVTAGDETKRPPSPAVQGLSAQEVAELVQMLAAMKLENERLRAVAIPRLTRQQLERLIAESLPYQWMALVLKAYSATDANWDAHELAKAIWTVVHEELRNKRQGMTSHLSIPQGTGATAPGTVGAPIGRVVRAPGGQAVVGAPQGGPIATPADSLDIGHANARKRRSRARYTSHTYKAKYPRWGIRRSSPAIRGGRLI